MLETAQGIHMSHCFLSISISFKKSAGKYSDCFSLKMIHHLRAALFLFNFFKLEIQVQINLAATCSFSGTKQALTIAGRREEGWGGAQKAASLYG